MAAALLLIVMSNATRITACYGVPMDTGASIIEKAGTLASVLHDASKQRFCAGFNSSTCKSTR